MGTVLIPIPDRDFDPTEVAVSWDVLTAKGHRVIFATENGTPGVDARRAYQDMLQSQAPTSPSIPLATARSTAAPSWTAFPG